MPVLGVDADWPFSTNLAKKCCTAHLPPVRLGRRAFTVDSCFDIISPLQVEKCHPFRIIYQLEQGSTNQQGHRKTSSSSHQATCRPNSPISRALFEHIRLVIQKRALRGMCSRVHEGYFIRPKHAQSIGSEP